MIETPGGFHFTFCGIGLAEVVDKRVVSFADEIASMHTVDRENPAVTVLKQAGLRELRENGGDCREGGDLQSK